MQPTESCQRAQAVGPMQRRKPIIGGRTVALLVSWKADGEAELSEVDTASAVAVQYVNNGLKVIPSNGERTFGTDSFRRLAAAPTTCSLCLRTCHSYPYDVSRSQVGTTTYHFPTGEHVCRLLRLMHSKKAGGRVRTI
jgi:hypothetical protein